MYNFDIEIWCTICYNIIVRERNKPLTKGSEEMNEMTDGELAVLKAEKAVRLEILRMLDKVKTLEDLEQVKAEIEAKTQ